MKQPCSAGCPGVAVFDSNFDPPPGFVHIERCDECDRFYGDMEAARSFTDEVYLYCTHCEDLSPMIGSGGISIFEWEQNHERLHPRQGGLRVVVPKIEAHLAGLLPARKEYELFDEEGWALKIRRAKIILEKAESLWMTGVWWAKEKIRRWRSRR
jgi:hypothetical protein